MITNRILILGLIQFGNVTHLNQSRPSALARVHPLQGRQLSNGENLTSTSSLRFNTDVQLNINYLVIHLWDALALLFALEQRHLLRKTITSTFDTQ